ncbi:MAG: hypothetical protein V3V09_05960 [Arenicellales bacterium]
MQKNKYKPNSQKIQCRFILAGFLLSFSSLSHALGPMDGEASINWWGNAFSGNPFNGTLDAGTLNLRGAGWWDKKWGISAGANLSDIDTADFEDPRRFNLDIKRRLISPTDNTFIAAGLGWESLNLATGESSSGLRLSLEGRFGLAGIAAIYGESVWMPSLSAVDQREDLSGIEFETGVVFNPLPFVSVRAAYRHFKLDYRLSNEDGNGQSTAKGFLIGTGIHW